MRGALDQPLALPVIPRKAAPVALQSDATTSDAFLAITAECIDHWQCNVDAISPDRPEALHQARVGVRRFRSALSLFARELDVPQVRWLGDEIRELALPLGDARDLDVLLGGDGNGPDLGPAAREALEERRRAAYATVGEVLESARWADAWDLVDRFRGHAPWDLDPDRPAPETAAAALDRRWRRIRRSRSLTELDAAQRHRVRIQAKKLRYGSQFFADLFVTSSGTPPTEFAEVLGDAQDQLGVLNDHHVQELILESVGVELPAHDEPKAVRSAQAALDRVLDQAPFWR